MVIEIVRHDLASATLQQTWRTHLMLQLTWCHFWLVISLKMKWLPGTRFLTPSSSAGEPPSSPACTQVNLPDEAFISIARGVEGSALRLRWSPR